MIGTPITRQRALELSKEIMENAENERLKSNLPNWEVVRITDGIETLVGWELTEQEAHEYATELRNEADNFYNLFKVRKCEDVLNV